MKCSLPPPLSFSLTHTHTQKVEVLDKLDRAMSIVIVRCHCGVNKLKIFFIKKHEDKIRRIIMASAPQV